MLALGIDIGTSGVRTAVIGEDGNPVAQLARADHQPDAATNADSWWVAVSTALRRQVELLKNADVDPSDITRLAIDGTSGSMVLTDAQIQPVTNALLYNTGKFAEAAQSIDAVAPEDSITRGPSSALARFLTLQHSDADNRAAHLLHQADFIAAKLAGRSLGTDDTNALKTGWDPETQSWPAWFEQAGVDMHLLPKVGRVGDALGEIDPQVADELGLPEGIVIHGGTTDSIAAFLASGARQVGDAVTSLGTTLAIKLLSDRRVDDPACGVYSHKVGDMWLAGGASNTGGGVLAHFFNSDQLADLSSKMDPEVPTGLDYYPLLKPGERFPTNAPNLEPRLEPRPEEDALFLQGMLEGIATVEADGYQRLQALGAPQVGRIYTAGGGAKNPVWTTIRQRHTSAEFAQAANTEAAIGAAHLCFG